MWLSFTIFLEISSIWLYSCCSLGKSLCSDEFDSLNVSKFHNWFHDGVIQWLDIALFKALQRVKKAVELDTLVPVDSSVKYSSSAVDTFAIFYQVNFIEDSIDAIHEEAKNFMLFYNYR